MKPTDKIFFEHTEGNLSPKELQELMDQCAHDEDLVDELELWKNTKDELPKMVYPNKRELIKPWYYFVADRKIFSTSILCTIAIIFFVVYPQLKDSVTTESAAQKINNFEGSDIQMTDSKNEAIKDETKPKNKIQCTKSKQVKSKHDFANASKNQFFAVAETSSDCAEVKIATLDLVDEEESTKYIELTANVLNNDSIYSLAAKMPNEPIAPAKIKQKLKIKNIFNQLGKLRWKSDITIPIKGF